MSTPRAGQSLPEGLLQQRLRVTRRVTLVGAEVNLVLSAAKIYLGVVGRSEALIVDGVHSISDLLSDALVYVAAQHAAQQADAEHPYGHGRFETVATLGLAILLVLVALGIGWDALARMFSPTRLMAPTDWALWGALASIFCKEALYHYTASAARRLGSKMLRANAWHHRSDAISSVVVLAGIAGTMAGLPYLDAVAALLVGVMIAQIGWQLGWGAIQELVDAGLEKDRLSAIRTTILAVGGVRSLHTLRTRRLGGHACADVHVQVEPWLSVSEGHQIAVLVEQRLKHEIDEIEDVTVHIDPEDDESSPGNALLPARAEAVQVIDSAWSGIVEAASRIRVTFHYLGGQIHADVYFPLERFTDLARVRELQAALTEALRDSPEFGRVHLYYG